MDDWKSNVTICQFQGGLKNEKVKLEVDRSRTVLALFVKQVLGVPSPLLFWICTVTHLPSTKRLRHPLG